MVAAVNVGAAQMQAVLEMVARSEKRELLCEARPFLDALVEGSAYTVTHQEHRGFPLDIVVALRPDGKIQVSCETTNPFDGHRHTGFWLLQNAARSQAIALAVRETSSMIERLLEARSSSETGKGTALATANDTRQVARTRAMSA